MHQEPTLIHAPLAPPAALGKAPLVAPPASGGLGAAVQLTGIPIHPPGRGPSTIQAAAAPTPNRTGLPDGLKTGVESLSGISLDAVQVHYNSSKPAQLNALAYAQGTDIHVAPGQERHLPHEAWHVVQQAQGRVRPTMQMKDGVPVNDDGGLEHEADVMGAKALATQRSVDLAQPRRAAPPPIAHQLTPDGLARSGNSADTIQRRMGYELELLTLVDINGRPPPEKAVLGTYQGLELQVDHNGSVEGQTPVDAADANFTAPMPTGNVPLGAYDLPANRERQMGQTGVLVPVADPRAGLAYDRLQFARWTASTVQDRYTRPPAANNTGLNNAALILIDQALPLYAQEFKQWEAARAVVHLTTIANAVDAWAAANPRPPEPGTFDFAAKRRMTRFQEARVTLGQLKIEAVLHRIFWSDPTSALPPAGFRPEYRTRAAGGNPPGAWSTRHPVAGGGGNRYASILEIVTPPREPETLAGSAALLTDIGHANALAAAIEGATGNFANRALFNTIAGVNVAQATTHIGSDTPTRSPQSTDASIQSTFGVDLAQIPSLIKTVYGVGTQSRFDLKHQADVQNDDDSWDRRSRTELTAAVTDATAIINHIKGLPVFGPLHPAPSFVNLRGLLTLVCQYLRMGRHWSDGAAGSLDKNLTDLLSRTNLSFVYRDTVPAAEKVWINAAGANLNLLIAQIFANTHRTQGSLLFNRDTENLAAHLSASAITCQQFTSNVFTQATDGVTEHLGGFQLRNVEDIDPLAARGGDTRRVAAAHREGPVFELRNMVPKGINAAERYPRAQWVPLATYMVQIIALLNARTEAQATADARVRENPAPAIAAEPNVW